MTEAMPDTMQAVQLRQQGGFEFIEVGVAPVPLATGDEVLIKVATVAVNRQDINLISGRIPGPKLTWPHVLGLDPAGVIVGLGPDASERRLGERVVVKPPISCGACAPCLAGEDDACERISSVGIHRPGGMAEYTTVPERAAFPISQSLEFAEATAISHTFPVALTLLRKIALAADDTVLVSGASGAVGSAVVQLARSQGARVIAAVGSERGASWLRELPANLAPDSIVDYAETAEFASSIRAENASGASVYVETASDPAVWSEATKALGRRARIAVVGSHAGPIVSLNNNWLFRERISILGCSGSTVAAYRDALEIAAAGGVVPNIDSIMPLQQAADAYQQLVQRQNRGKIVLRVADI